MDKRKKDDYWGEMLDDCATVGIKVYGIIDVALIIIGIVLKIFGYL